jgi:hypothetical protein
MPGFMDTLRMLTSPISKFHVASADIVVMRQSQILRDRVLISSNVRSIKLTFKNNLLVGPHSGNITPPKKTSMQKKDLLDLIAAAVYEAGHPFTMYEKLHFKRSFRTSLGLTSHFHLALPSNVASWKPLIHSVSN